MAKKQLKRFATRGQKHVAVALAKPASLSTKSMCMTIITLLIGIDMLECFVLICLFTVCSVWPVGRLVSVLFFACFTVLDP